MTSRADNEQKIRISGDSEGFGLGMLGWSALVLAMTLGGPAHRYINAQTKLTCAQLHQIEPDTICRFGKGKLKYAPLPAALTTAKKGE